MQCIKKIDEDFKQDGRPALAYFPPSNFAKNTFQNDESVFSKKLSFLPKLKIFGILQKTPQSGGKTTILWNKFIWYAFCSKFASFTDFEINQTFFEKKAITVSKKTLISYVLRNLTILVPFYGKFATFW